VPLKENDRIVERPAEQHTLTLRYTEHAVQFIHEHKQKPFFLYFAHTFPHVPLFASARFSGTSPRGPYGDAVAELDWSVGQLMDTLRREGLADNTFVFFTSDNGPWLIQLQQGGSAGLLRDGKGSTWEGGMREPGIAWWPGRIKPAQVCHEMGSTMDLFATCINLAGGRVPADRPIDGVDMAPLLFGTGKGNRQIMFYYRGTQFYAVRKGPFKAHYLTRSDFARTPEEKHDPPLLFNLEIDPSERFDVAKIHPDVLEDIAREVEKHRAGLVPGKQQVE
jgi:arylsulfatase A